MHTEVNKLDTLRLLLSPQVLDEVGQIKIALSDQVLLSTVIFMVSRKIVTMKKTNMYTFNH